MLSDALDVAITAAAWPRLRRTTRWLVAASAGSATIVGTAGALPPPGVAGCYVPEVRPHTAPPPGTDVDGEYGLMAGPDWAGTGVRSLG
jgi:hypothetical protein